MQEISDNDIIKDILNGNTEQYRLLVEKYQQAIFRVCMGYVHSEDDANDLAQDTFINAYQNLSKFSFNASFSTWLYRIGVNASLNFLRSKRHGIFWRFEDLFGKSSQDITFDEIDINNPEEILISEEHKTFIQKEIDNLSEKQRTAFVLSKYDELSQKEVAEIMNITEGAVESLLQRAKANLQKKLSKYFQKKIK